MSRIRFGGSVALATLSALMRSPEAVFGCALESTAMRVERLVLSEVLGA